MDTNDILQLIYDRSGVDEKVNMQRAFPDVRFVPGKLTLPDIVVKRIEYKDIRYLHYPRDDYIFDPDPESAIVQRPHHSREFSTLYVSASDKFALHTGPYRIEKKIGKNTVRTRVMTSSKVDFAYPRMFLDTYFGNRYYRRHLDGADHPWKDIDAYLKDEPRYDIRRTC